MNITINFKHFDHTESLDEIIHHKSERLKKFLGDQLDVQWTCFLKDNTHFADIKILGPTFCYKAKASSENLYKTIDLTLHKIEKQVAKKKDKWKNHIHHKHDSPLKTIEYESKESDDENDSSYDSYDNAA